MSWPFPKAYPSPVTWNNAARIHEQLEQESERNREYVAHTVTLPNGARFTKCKPSYAFAPETETDES